MPILSLNFSPFLGVLKSDKVSREKRSQIMSRIRGKDTKLEQKFQAKYPTAIPHPDFLPFRPDFCMQITYFVNIDVLGVVRQSYVEVIYEIIFLDSTFWHGFVSAKAFSKMRKFWSEKLTRNIIRDFCANAFWETVEREIRWVNYIRIGEKTWRELLRKEMK